MTISGRRSASPRLEAIAELIPVGSRVVDVGCDHGRLAVGLLATGRASRVIATEVDDAILASLRARDLPAVQDGRLALRVGDGFDALRGEDRADVAVLAGMGASTICGILSSVPRVTGIRRAVLQPQSDAGRLRTWLLDSGWAIADERCVDSRGRFYQIVAAEPGSGARAPAHPELDRADLCEAGPWLVHRRDRCAARHWARTVARYEKIVASTPPGPDRDAAADHLARARRVVRVLG